MQTFFNIRGLTGTKWNNFNSLSHSDVQLYNVCSNQLFFHNRTKTSCKIVKTLSLVTLMGGGGGGRVKMSQVFLQLVEFYLIPVCRHLSETLKIVFVPYTKAVLISH